MYWVWVLCFLCEVRVHVWCLNYCLWAYGFTLNFVFSFGISGFCFFVCVHLLDLCFCIHIFLYFGLVFEFRFNVVLVFKVSSLGFELCALRLTFSFRRYSIVCDIFLILYFKYKMICMFMIFMFLIFDVFLIFMN